MSSASKSNISSTGPITDPESPRRHAQVTVNDSKVLEDTPAAVAPNTSFNVKVDDAAAKARERLERFKELKARAVSTFIPGSINSWYMMQ
jgi:hypothetical protein